MKVGAVVMPGSEMLRSKDILYRSNHAGAKAVVSMGAIAEEVEEVRAGCPSLTTFVHLGGKREGWLSFDQLMEGQSTEFAPVQTRSDEMAFLSYTSGTTGGPK